MTSHPHREFTGSVGSCMSRLLKEKQRGFNIVEWYAVETLWMRQWIRL
jgi:hypothetical protein